jgi:hypothetical protein
MRFDIMNSIVAGSGMLIALMAMLWLLAGRSTRKTQARIERARHTEHHEG